MKFNNPKKIGRLVFGMGAVILTVSLVGIVRTKTEVTPEDLIKNKLNTRTQIAQTLKPYFDKMERPLEVDIEINGQSYEKARVQYTLDPELQKEAERLLRSYRPDYGAIFMFDAESGEVLAYAGQFRDSEEEKFNLLAHAGYPAASLFKLITATAAIDKAGVSPDHKIHYNGGAYTLYKRNVLSEQVTRWTNVISLRDAFARSINTAFGRLSIENLEPQDLNDYAERFMFNQQIPADFPIEMGSVTVPDSKGYELAEIASGYNRHNSVSPAQAAMLAGAVINHGVMNIPFMVKHIYSQKGELIYSGEPLEKGAIMNPASAEKVKALMERTVTSGTSRRSFKPLFRNSKIDIVEVGGKTGHLAGTNPQGRTDWFIGYAANDERKVAVSALTVNKKFWTVKSAHLGQVMFQKYFRGVPPNRHELTSK